MCDYCGSEATTKYWNGVDVCHTCIREDIQDSLESGDFESLYYATDEDLTDFF